MYRWPQGRIVRVSAMLLALVIAADIGFNGAWSKLGNLASGVSSTSGLVVGIIYAILAVVLLIGVVGAVGFHRQAVDFLIEVEDEMIKVEWPARSVLVRSTIVIAIAAAILVGIILGVDLINITALDALRKLGG